MVARRQPLAEHRKVGVDDLIDRRGLARVVPTRQPVAHAQDAEGDHLRIADGREFALALAGFHQPGPQVFVRLPDAVHCRPDLAAAGDAVAQADGHFQAVPVETLEVVVDRAAQLFQRGRLRGDDFLHAFDESICLRTDDGQQDFGAAAVVVVERLPLDADGLRHVVERGVDVALAIEQFGGSAQDGLAPQVGLAQFDRRRVV